MRCVKFLLALFFITFLFANCSNGDGSGGVTLKEGESTVLSFGGGGAWTYVIVYGASKPIDTDSLSDGEGVIVDDPSAAETPTINGHAILTGSIQHAGYSGGEFLVEARGTKSCGDSICADMDGVPTASSKTAQPGFFSIIVPKTDQAIYLVASFTDNNQVTFTKNIYLGLLDGRVDELEFDFGPEEEEPAPTPTADPTPGPGGPTDLATNP